MWLLAWIVVSLAVIRAAKDDDKCVKWCVDDLTRASVLVDSSAIIFSLVCLNV
jgi:hypothetical protein